MAMRRLPLLFGRYPISHMACAVAVRAPRGSATRAFGSPHVKFFAGARGRSSFEERALAAVRRCRLPSIVAVCRVRRSGGPSAGRGGAPLCRLCLPSARSSSGLLRPRGAGGFSAKSAAAWSARSAPMRPISREPCAVAIRAPLHSATSANRWAHLKFFAGARGLFSFEERALAAVRRCRCRRRLASAVCRCLLSWSSARRSVRRTGRSVAV
jgi:hypothetical protein